jgi:hypothetical protein
MPPLAWSSRTLGSAPAGSRELPGTVATGQTHPLAKPGAFRILSLDESSLKSDTQSRAAAFHVSRCCQNVVASVEVNSPTVHTVQLQQPARLFCSTQHIVPLRYNIYIDMISSICWLTIVPAPPGSSVYRFYFKRTEYRQKPELGVMHAHINASLQVYNRRRHVLNRLRHAAADSATAVHCTDPAGYVSAELRHSLHAGSSMEQPGQ